MVRFQPLDDIVANCPSELPHFESLAVRNRAGPLVSVDVPFLAKGIKAGNDRRRRMYGEAERLNHPVVMLIAARSISGSGVSGCGRLESSVIGDIQRPISAEASRGAVRQ